MGKPAVGIEIKGIQETLSHYSRLPKNVIDGIVDGVNRATAIVEGGAKRICPVDTGLLRNSIHIKPATVLANEVTGAVYTAVEYAPYVEFGTGVRGEVTNTNEKYPVAYSSDWAGQIAQPFLYPALENNKDKIEKMIYQSIAQSLAR